MAAESVLSVTDVVIRSEGSAGAQLCVRGFAYFGRGFARLTESRAEYERLLATSNQATAGLAISFATDELWQFREDWNRADVEMWGDIVPPAPENCSIPCEVSLLVRGYTVRRRYALAAPFDVEGLEVIELPKQDPDFTALHKLAEDVRDAIVSRSVGKLLENWDPEQRSSVEREMGDPDSYLQWRLFGSARPLSQLVAVSDVRLLTWDDPAEISTLDPARDERIACFASKGSTVRRLTLRELISPAIGDNHFCFSAVRVGGGWKVSTRGS